MSSRRWHPRNASAERGGYSYCAKIIAAVAVAFLLVVFFDHLPAARDPAPDRLRRARQIAVAAAAAGAVVAEAADHKHPAISLFGRAPHPWLQRQKAA